MTIPCSQQSRERGGDIIGISKRERQLVLELEKPWEKSPLNSPGLSREIQEKILRYSKKNTLVFIGVAPDAEYSINGFSQVWDTQKRDAVFVTEKYHVPSHDLEDFLQNLLFSREGYQKYRVHYDTQDYLLCTHGSRDFCCGKFGLDLYQELRDEVKDHSALRVWQCTHLGGHRLAPTMCHLNSMRWWGLLNAASARDIFFQRKEVKDLIQYYRGFALLKNVQEQMAERYFFSLNNWAWLTYSSSISSFKKNSSTVSVSVNFIKEKRDYKNEIIVEESAPVSIFSSCKDTEPSWQKTYLLRAKEEFKGASKEEFKGGRKEGFKGKLRSWFPFFF